MRRSGWTSSDEFQISDAGAEEAERFLQPLTKCSVVHVGWKGFDPVFRPEEDVTVTEVRSQVQGLLDNSRIRSAGHRAFFLEPDSGSDKPSRDSVSMVLKVEDWMTGCIPNTMHDDRKEREEYIEEREQKMYERLVSSDIVSGMEILINRHVDSGGLYGQYQFLAIRER